MRQLLLIIVGLLITTNSLAQASGGQIRRGSAKVSKPLSNKQRILGNLIRNMVFVKGGTFAMGATKDQGEQVFEDEKPMHYVTLSSFYIGKYEVTQEEWFLIMGNNPSENKGNKLPVENVDWYDCHEFIEKLNEMTGKDFRLPTEAEWEYAARGGNRSQWNKYSGSNQLGDIAWFIDNSREVTHNVGLKRPNELGLYDMSGNVWEWCEDWYGEYEKDNPLTPTGSVYGSNRVIRGGGWESRSANCRTAARRAIDPQYYSENIGFRLVLEE